MPENPKARGSFGEAEPKLPGRTSHWFGDGLGPKSGWK